MRFVAFGDDRLGIIEDDRIVEITSVVTPQERGPALERVIRSGGIGSIENVDLATLPSLPIEEVNLGAPVAPSKIVAAPVNYLDHKMEMHESSSIADYGVFLKAPTSVIGPGGTVVLPYTDVRTDHEGELAVVIGREARHVTVADALDYVFGYTCALDMTIRSTEDRSTRKSFDTFTPLGTQVVSADEVPDPGALELTCTVNGQLRQKASTSELIFGVPELIAYASSVMTLHPGDVLLTGTPAGVGPVADGDRVVVEIEAVGRLEVSVTDRGAVPYAQRPGHGRQAEPVGDMEGGDR